MYFKGEDFTYTFNGESKTKEEIEKLINYDTTISVDGLSINYFSPKKERLEMAQKFKEEALEQIGISPNTHCQQSSQSFYMDTDIMIEKLNLITYKKDLIDNLEGKLTLPEMFLVLQAETRQGLVDILGKIDFAQKNKMEEDYKTTTVKVNTSPEDRVKIKRMQEYLKEVRKHQEQNGGRVEGAEFPFDSPTREEREQKAIEDWNKEGWSLEDFLKTIPESQKLPGGYIRGKVFKYDTSNIGVKNNKHKAPLDILQTRQFPKALQLLALATAYGNHKYKNNDLDFLNFKRVEGGSQTYLDASARHSTDRFGTDEESKLPHFIHAVWNQLAALQLWAEQNELNIEEFSKDYLKHLEVSK